MSNDLINFLVALLPTAISIMSVLVGIKLASGENHKFWWAIVLIAGIAFSVLTRVSQVHTQSQHEREINEQQQATASLRGFIQTSEIRKSEEIGYLSAQLEDALSHRPVPFDARLFARTFERELRQSIEVLSNKRLSDDASQFARKLRQFSAEVQSSRGQRYADERREVVAAMQDPQTRNAVLQKWFEIESQTGQKETIKFKADYLDQALWYRDELWTRLGIHESQIPGQATESQLAFRGILAGRDPLGEAASYLDSLAHQLMVKTIKKSLHHVVEIGGRALATDARRGDFDQ